MKLTWDEDDIQRKRVLGRRPAANELKDDDFKVSVFVCEVHVYCICTYAVPLHTQHIPVSDITSLCLTSHPCV